MLVVNPQKFTSRGGSIMKKPSLNSDVDTSAVANFWIDDYDKNFVYPDKIDYRDFCLPTGNQGDTPHCVGYTVAGYFEVNYWKKYHIPKQFNSQKIYQFGREYKADTIEGTKLEYSLISLLHFLYTGRIYTIVPRSIENLKYITHQYGCMMLAMKITDEWYDLTRDGYIKRHKKPYIIGGHCVLCCGYCKDGIYIQNCWGYEKWGNYGFAVIPWDLALSQIDYVVFIDNFNFMDNMIGRFLNESGCRSKCN